ncbi:hypothetical protein [Enterococcus sp. HY326]|uniref:hypothetical protein n=1 Tax=Enterococcus sp. HY326 TaxID=2971265 RepID=UPI00223F65EA|nr:hypothetical protein [Enterococcus sp. HY326]
MNITKEKIDALSCFLAALVLLAFTLIFNEIAIGLVLAALTFPSCRFLASKFYKRKQL